jgi:serine/threonine-protein kinase
MGGRFRLEGVLGRGAAGTVYLAKDEVLDEVVALKVLAPTLASQPEFRARFRAESITLASLSHPNVVRVHDYFEDEAGAYLVMDRVDGPSLRQLLAAYGHLAPEQACGVLGGALSGLAFAHEKGLLHGDVKPENVLVDMAGDSKLTDFGQAIPIGSVATGGTGAYMSPETLGGRPLDERSDLYSMGAVLYECFAGRAPFGAGQDATLAFQTAHELPAAITGLPSPMARLVARALAKDPSERPQSARDFLSELGDAARKSFGADWVTRAGVAALAGGVGVGVALASGAGSAGATAAATAGGVGSAGLGGGGSAASSTGHSGHWLSKFLLANKAATVAVTAVIVTGAVVGGVVAARSPANPKSPAAASTATIISHPAPTTLIRQPRATANWTIAWQSSSALGLNAIACSSRTNCIAVGTDGQVPAVEVTQDGGAQWSAVNVEAPASPNGAGPTLSGIACSSPGFCTAVGGYGNGSGASALILTTSDGGITWTPRTVSGALPPLYGIACPTSQRCIAVGGIESSPEPGSPSVVVTDDGGSVWTEQSAPEFSSALGDISCPSRSDCYAVGELGQGSPVLFKTSDGGGTWQSAPGPSGFATGQMTGISCASVVDCVAIGSSASEVATGVEGSPGNAAAFVTRSGGQSWSGAQLSSGLDSVAQVLCVSTLDCLVLASGPNPKSTAVGSGYILGTADGGLEWNAETLPEGGSDLYPQSVACPSVVDCLAVAGSGGGGALVLSDLPLPHGGVKTLPAQATTTTIATTVPATPVATEAQAAQALASLLSQSMDDRNAINAANSDVEACGDPEEDEQTFAGAARSRQELISQLSVLPGRSTVPASMLAALDAAWQASQQVDQDYAAWAGDESSGHCTAGDTANSSYQAATQLNAEATADKVEFVATWDPIATTYNLPTYQGNQL